MSTVNWATKCDALLSTTTVDCSVSSKQALYTVPVGKQCVITKVVVRSASADLSPLWSDVFNFGFNAGAADYGSISGSGMISLTDATKAIGFSKVTLSPTNDPTTAWVIGDAGDVFGCMVADPQVTATIVIDTFGYIY